MFEKQFLSVNMERGSSICKEVILQIVRQLRNNVPLLKDMEFKKNPRICRNICDQKLILDARLQVFRQLCTENRNDSLLDITAGVQEHLKEIS